MFSLFPLLSCVGVLFEAGDYILPQGSATLVVGKETPACILLYFFVIENTKIKVPKGI